MVLTHKPTKMKVMCVDDEPLILMSIKLQLEDHFDENFSIETAQSAEEAIEILHDLDNENDLPCIVVSDQSMPQMKGIEFLAFVKEKYPNIVRVLLTGYLYDEKEQVAKQLELYKFISKPWDIKRFNQTIESGLAFCEND